MLNSHSQIAFTPETHFIRKHIANIKEQKLFKNCKYHILKNNLLKDPELNRIDIDIKALIKNQLSSSQSLTQFYKLFLSNHLEYKQKQIIGDKDPKNLEHLVQIKRIYPSAKIIHIIRDPRDVVLSRLKAEWSKDRGITIHALTYQLQYQKACRDGSRLFDENYFEIQYENLITDPHSTLAGLCSFLGIPYEKNMLNFYKNSWEIVKDEEKNWKAECFQPVKSNNLNKWKKKLSPAAIYLIENISHSVFKENRYQRSDSLKAVKFTTKIKSRIIKIILPLINFFYKLYHRIKDHRLKKYL
jgi:hypothetical protein